MKPAVTIDNIPEVYEFYRDNPVNLPFVKAAHWLLGQTIDDSQISFWSPDAEDYLHDRLADGAQVVFAANHRSAFDQFILAGLPGQLDCLKPMIGKTFIPSKTEIFNEAKWQRWAIDQLGAIPAYRGKDFPAQDDPRRAQAAELLFNVSVDRILRGQHMAGFWEGTRNKEEPHVVQKIQRGIGEIVCRAQTGADLLVLPIGYVYDERQPESFRLPRKLRKPGAAIYNYFHPTIHLGQPLEGKFDTPDQVVAQLRPAMQESLDIALDNQRAA